MRSFRIKDKIFSQSLEHFKSIKGVPKEETQEDTKTFEHFQSEFCKRDVVFYRLFKITTLYKIIRHQSAVFRKIY
jgi:uncharacterized lipoprotein YehR (DUF1307 family)